MKRPRILVAREVFAEVIARLAEAGEIELHTGDLPMSREQLAARMADVDAVFSTPTERIDEAIMSGAPRLRVIANMAVGFNNIDLDAATRRGIVVTNTPDVLTETTADFGWALLLATARRVTESERWLRAGQWKTWRYDSFLGADVHGSTLGIFGMGRIGRALARRAYGFNMRVLYHNRSRLSEELEAEAGHACYVDKETLFRESDHVIVVVPYSSETHHAVGESALQVMKSSACLINIARGGVVDDHALIQALRTGRIAAAGLDVFENEPAFDAAMLDLPNLVMTPHIASASAATRRAMAHCAADNLLAALRGERPRHVVN